MRRLALVLAGSIWLAVSIAQTNEPSDQDVIKVLAAEGSSLTSLDSLETNPPEKAWHQFLFMTGSFQSKYPAFFKKAGRAIGRNEGVANFLEEKFQIDQSKPQPQASYLDALGGIPSVWSARILGAHLMSEVPMDLENVDDDVQITPNRIMAGRALRAMGFSDAPPQQSIPSHLTPDEILAWKAWWVANEGRIEQRIAEINPEYHAPPTPTPWPKPRSLIFTPTPAAETVPGANPGAEPQIAKPEKSDWLLYAGALLLAGITAAGVLLLRRRG